MSRYSWVTNGFSLTGAFPTTPQTVFLPIPAASTVKRFQLRGCYISMNSENVDQSHIRAPIMNIVIQYIPEFESGRQIYQSNRAIPFHWSVFEAPPAIPVYDFLAGAADNELGVDQPCSYGKLTGPPATLRLDTYVYGYPFLPGDYSGEWDLTFAALVFT